MSKGSIHSIVCLDDFRVHAKDYMPKEAFAYFDSGSGEQITKKQNETSFHRLMIIPRILKSISQPSMSTKIFGKELNLPFGIAPTAMQAISHPEGEAITARVAYEKNIIMTLSTLSTTSFGDVSKVNQTGMRLFQMYISSDWQMTIAAIRLAEKYHFQGLVITVDAQVLGNRITEYKHELDSSRLPFPVLDQIRAESKRRNQNTLEPKRWLANRDLSMNWQTIKKIRQNTHLKIILKGILNPKDAQIAVDYCDAVWVSNHGGRQLDLVSATIDILPSIRSVVQGKVPIFIDGGIRTGNDIFKCLALGADYVFIGRPFIYSLLLGYEGATKCMKILEEELRRCMVLVGCHSLKQIKADSICPQPSL